MATQYPSKIDNGTTLPEVVDLATIHSADVYNRLRNAIIAIEAELGTTPSSVYATVKVRFETLEETVGNLQIISLAGDLGGSLATPTVIGLRGTPISSTAPTANQGLVFNGTSWTPANLAEGSLAFTAANDLSGSSLTQTVIGLQGRSLASTAPTDGYAIVWDETGETWKPGVVSSGGATAYEMSFASGLYSTTSSAFTRIGGRKIDMSIFPATAGLLTRSVKFIADVDMTAGATTVEFQLYDSTNAVIVTGTNATSSSTVNVEIESAALTVGSSAGNIRNDTPAQYELQLKMNGGGGGDAVFCTNARLIVSYA